MADPRRIAVERSRACLATLAARSERARRIMKRTGEELVGATSGVAAAKSGDTSDEGQVTPESVRYDEAYFGVGRDPSGNREGRSGYARYDRVASNADIAARLIWRNFRVHRTLDVGCGTGYLVEALRELGLDAHGCDASPFAVDHAADGARGHVVLGDPIRGLPYEDGEFDLVSVLETLEHLPPEEVPSAIGELRRVCCGLLYATIPSFGRNPSGPAGHFEGKVRPERLEHYKALGSAYEGPVPTADLEVDADGAPIEGHLTIASFSWWARRLTEAGFEQWLDAERRCYADIAPTGLAKYWNLYVFGTPGASASLAAQRRPDRNLRELGLVHPLVEHAFAEACITEEG